MSQSQSELETYIELHGPDGEVIDTVVIPPEEMAKFEEMAKGVGLSTEDFINAMFQAMLEGEEPADVDS